MAFSAVSDPAVVLLGVELLQELKVVLHKTANNARKINFFILNRFLFNRFSEFSNNLNTCLDVHYIPHPICILCFCAPDFWSFIPQMEHLPGFMEVISGCIGHEYRAADFNSKAIPHFGHLPGELL
jgi:hypothetical protein